MAEKFFGYGEVWLQTYSKLLELTKNYSNLLELNKNYSKLLEIADIDRLLNKVERNDKEVVRLNTPKTNMEEKDIACGK